MVSHVDSWCIWLWHSDTPPDVTGRARQFSCIDSAFSACGVAWVDVFLPILGRAMDLGMRYCQICLGSLVVYIYFLCYLKIGSSILSYSHILIPLFLLQGNSQIGDGYRKTPENGQPMHSREVNPITPMPKELQWFYGSGISPYMITGSWP